MARLTRRRSRVPLFAPTMSTACPHAPLRALKICGIVSPSDAELAVSVARPLLPPDTDLLIGTILWPHSKRSVLPPQARAIAAAARANGATPVAVFVDETLSEMEAACRAGRFGVAQLHGPRCRRSWGAGAEGLQWIDVSHVSPNGDLVEDEFGGGKGGEPPLWRLFDASGGGTGEAFDWGRFRVPGGEWLLAGGLHPGNVGKAVATLHPAGVDVASGVAGEDRCRKDEAKMRRFVERLVEAYASE